MGNESITPRQLMIIVILYSIGTAILVIPASVAADAKQDAWIPILLSTVMGVILTILYTSIAKKFPDSSLFDINDFVFGKWLGRLITLSISLLTLIFSAQDVFYVGHFMVTQIMPTTPVQAINILFILVVIMGAKLGMVVFLRTAEIFFPWLILLFIMFMTMNIPNMDMNNLLPLGEATAVPILRSVIRITCFTFITLFIAINPILHQVSNKQRARKGYLAGVIISGLTLFLLVISSILVLGADTTAMESFPSYALAQRINIGNFLQRIEVVVAFLWLVSIYFKASMYFHTTIRGLAHVFRVREPKTLCLPIGLLVTVLSLVVYPNEAYEQEWDYLTYIPLSLIMGILYPLVIALIGWVKGRRLHGAK
ncbi:GerAB/ArcD/ProY family transporter [Paenibacillus planticolens]|uniref:GerAB/ArcD/ProY family transporter n=1 Tax=Paenibacillus planticolens TaxID=2654976 RepID=A0ABX1ZQA4_9BACL|nr:endospore germination permease [Paenibacillus planticolens]NOV01072.1 GerAB/ArcD/ProY family transporter [Paenibacillus planticolens]